ncbi:leucyl/phenylalanyl-tRNA--protein transferase [Aliarcobacter butzleri]|uniref:Leucyl/phenylalanyl-tRNA--protein transferase n=1 Tax=Aliarcobacter butzleri TaxID=28197 RepID=A0AAW6VHA7_9BACT|nr:leucyl/phenylalanyl-tRNA--protein transferase [Aliarcobacter butzleri]MCG3650756.1 leucyl/phenylalanyl-tRNA--protein transferase [Aliarcobacter butzleri]MCG3658524.1 leucyl/phenylalanyl-tRNA--protein transferase [Aliarcobacter butzleri]MCG3671436.1 leucyl/phenylalanyl-tRNA--protein transferase [Aliarcobacter butzleri]MCG3689682.1 leucyl/phenylalanyl-tRNA--protein transferase [Aliarcobacter butzleri]MDK2041226.1 leucyl/phenylalanyl-tRNA--protein transferase [Aliarcobacter butzleri]
MKLIDKKYKIYLLDEEKFDFPTLNMMNDDLVAIGGDFHPQRLLNAYENGIFPWFIDDLGYIHWFSPQKRMVLYPENFKVSKSLRKSITNKGFVVKSNENFEEVIRSCAKIKRKHEDGTWISEEFIKAYTNLHELDIAFSIECYLKDELVGGLYGVLIGDIFCGESMFSLVPDASKVAFYHLCQQAKQNGIKIIDCQVYNDHLASLGAFEITRNEYFNLLKDS